MNNVVINICVQVFVEKYVFFNLGYMLGVEFLGHITPNCCKKWMHHSTSLPVMSEGSNFSKSLSILAIVCACVLMIAILVGYEVLSLCDLVYINLFINEAEIYLHVSIFHVYLFWGNFFFNHFLIFQLVCLYHYSYLFILATGSLSYILFVNFLYHLLCCVFIFFTVSFGMKKSLFMLKSKFYLLFCYLCFSLL